MLLKDKVAAICGTAGFVGETSPTPRKKLPETDESGPIPPSTRKTQL